MLGEDMTIEEVEAHVLGLPVPAGVALHMRQDDITKPTLAKVKGFWEYAIYAVRKNGLPLWKPATKRRPRRERYVVSVVVTENQVADTVLLQNATARVLYMAERSLWAIRRSRRAVKTREKNGYVHTTGGRPRGKTWDMENPACTRNKVCPRCKRRHRSGPCAGTGPARWPPA